MNPEEEKRNSSQSGGTGNENSDVSEPSNTINEQNRLAAAFASSGSLLVGEDIVPSRSDLEYSKVSLEGNVPSSNAPPTADAGKPPLQPRDFQQQPQGENKATISRPDHHRASSTGDHSFMSALTEPEENMSANSPSNASLRDNRNTGNAGPEILQPILSTTNGRHGRTSDQNSKIPSPTAKKESPKKVFGKVSLDDVLGLNPMESEAENAILKAVEMAQREQTRAQQSPTRHRRNMTAGSLLPSIPDESMEAFLESGNEDDDRNHVNDLTLPTEPKSPGEKMNSQNPPLPPIRPRLSSAAGGTSTTSQRLRSSQARLSPTSKRSVVGGGNETVRTFGTTPATKPKPLTTEEKLFGVTEQWKDLRTARREESEHDEFNIPLPDFNADSLNNAQDLLVKNANMLFRRSVKKEIGQDSAATGNEHIIQETTPQEAGVQDEEIGQIGSSKKTDDNEALPATTAAVSSTGFFNFFKAIKRGTQQAGTEMKQSYDYAHSYLKPKLGSIAKHGRYVATYAFLPALALSVGLYYAGNPRMCTSSETVAIEGNDGVENKNNTSGNTQPVTEEVPVCASISWFIIFLVIRQGITFGISKCCELLIIDLLSVRSRRMVKLIGPTFTLLIVQSKGWPFLLLFWAIWDFLLLYGAGKFANHWLFWQNLIPWFNEENPSGTITSNEFYKGVLIAAIIVGLSVSIKRLWMGIYLGKRTYTNYGKELAKVMNDMFLISIIGGIAHEIEIESQGQTEKRLTYSGFGGAINTETILQMWEDKGASEIEDEVSHSNHSPSRTPPRKPRTASNVSEISKDTPRSPEEVTSNTEGGSQQHQRSPLGDRLRAEPPMYESAHLSSKKIMAMKLLGDWDEPKSIREKNKNITISSILAFRQALEFMDDVFPFSYSFGPANTREACIESSQEVYNRLLLHNPDDSMVSFSTISLAALDVDGDSERKKVKQLRKLFIPDKDGFLTPLDFVKSVDKVYKSLRMLRASIQNSTQIDEAFEQIFNCIFYLILGCIVLSALGFDPFSLFLSLSSIILSFSFLIGAASAKYFEGILLIFARRPYDIGDRIAISDPKDDTNPGGSSAWFVENVTLYATTVRYATTNEVATYSNGSLAALRIINAKRSPMAIKFVNVKFGVDVPYSKVELFKAAVESFIKERPKEWISMSAFRATRVEADLGYIEYKIVAQHVEGWQNIGPILNSTAELNQYCLEVSKQLDMRYSAPPLPVQMDLAKPDLLAQMLPGTNNDGFGESAHSGMGTPTRV